VIQTPGLFNISSERGNTGFFGLTLVAAVSSTIETNGVFSPKIFPCLSVSGPGVENLFALFTFSPLFG